MTNSCGLALPYKYCMWIVNGERNFPGHPALEVMDAFASPVEERHGLCGHGLDITPEELDDLFHEFINTSGLTSWHTEEGQDECQAQDRPARKSCLHAWPPFPAPLLSESTPQSSAVGDIDARHQGEDRPYVEFPQQTWDLDSSESPTSCSENGGGLAFPAELLDWLAELR